MNTSRRRIEQVIHRAGTAVDRGNWLYAVNLLKAELDRLKSLDVAVELARLYMEKGRLPLAEELVDRAFGWAEVADPDSVCPLTDKQRELYLLKANLRLSQGDAEGSLSLYSLLLAERAHDPDLLFHAGLAYEKLAMHELAVAYLDRALGEDPEFTAAQEIKGQILLCIGRFDAALSLYLDLVLRDRSNVNAYVMLGHIYHHLKRPMEAETAWRRAIAIAPNADEPLRMLGRAALQKGDTATARGYFTRAVAAHPGNVAAHLDLADLLAELGETRAAVGHWDEAERLAPNHPRLVQAAERRKAAARAVAACCMPATPNNTADPAGHAPAFARAVASGSSPCAHCSKEEPVPS